MSRARVRDFAFAAAIVVLLVLHALGKQRDGLLPEMLWGCHVASLLAAIGLAGRVQRMIAVGFLFHLAIGIPAVVLELTATGTSMRRASLSTW